MHIFTVHIYLLVLHDLDLFMNKCFPPCKLRIQEICQKFKKIFERKFSRVKGA